MTLIWVFHIYYILSSYSLYSCYMVNWFMMSSTMLFTVSLRTLSVTSCGCLSHKFPINPNSISYLWVMSDLWIYQLIMILSLLTFVVMWISSMTNASTWIHNTNFTSLLNATVAFHLMLLPYQAEFNAQVAWAQFMAIIAYRL